MAATSPQAAMRVPFLITIDVEGDDLWARPLAPTTRNAEFLPRFQDLCERHGLCPTYLTNWEMGNSPAFREFAASALAANAAEVGMHLHAWHTPPLTPLTPADHNCQPFGCEYPEPVLREKVARLTDLLEDAFGQAMVSHRAGRWGFDGTYARVLLERGYRMDCSVTPHLKWCNAHGNPSGGVIDYTAAPETPYFLDLDEVSKPGVSSLLEVPMTIRLSQAPLSGVCRAIRRRGGALRRVADRLSPPVQWLRPLGRNRKATLALVRSVQERPVSHLEFMLHSSELMPGGSQRFARTEDVESLYDELEELFALASSLCAPQSCKQFAATWSAGGSTDASPAQLG